jgi:hypothetical protein
MDAMPWRLPRHTFKFKNSLIVLALAYLYLLALFLDKTGLSAERNRMDSLQLIPMFQGSVRSSHELTIF